MNPINLNTFSNIFSQQRPPVQFGAVSVRRKDGKDFIDWEQRRIAYTGMNGMVPKVEFDSGGTGTLKPTEEVSSKRIVAPEGYTAMAFNQDTKEVVFALVANSGYSAVTSVEEAAFDHQVMENLVRLPWREDYTIISSNFSQIG